MYRVVSEEKSSEEALRFMIRADLRSKMERLFETQGVNLKTGLNRLIEFLIDQPPDLHPYILGQIARGDVATQYANLKLKQMAASGEKLDAPLTFEQTAALVKTLVERMEYMGREFRKEAMGLAKVAKK